mgnify:CR=1 FL=1
MKKFKKLIATALATALCLALSVPCFAASAPSKDAVRLKVGESYTDCREKGTSGSSDNPGADRRQVLLREG